MEMKEPVRAVIPTSKYMVILKDADGVHHYWLRNGTYDGHDRQCKP